ncbi:MAG TPA: outer membrane lipoprotein carrier protein LolA [Thermoanaerobaculia bacterium]|nr:outer membrane lipoprotein carrier protein LolA [Thermoanaerobaculia bacterium]
MSRPNLSRSLLLLALSTVLVAGPAGADEPDPSAPGLSGRQRLEALIERVRAAQDGLETLEAEFVQERSSEFLTATESSSGTFSYQAPDRVRWEYVAPRPISLVIEGETMTTWFHDLGRAERLKVGRVSSQVFQYLNASGSLDKLLDYFTLTLTPPRPGEPWRVELDPRYPRVAKRLRSMTLWIDPERFLPTRVRYVEPNGDSTEYRLDKLRPNGGIPAERFRLELPRDVEVREVSVGEARNGNGAR